MKRPYNRTFSSFTPFSDIMIAKVTESPPSRPRSHTARNPLFYARIALLRRFLTRFWTKVGVFYAVFWPAFWLLTRAGVEEARGSPR